MPIQVQGPDGQLLEFPDGTPRETMKAAMAKRYGAPKQAPESMESLQRRAMETYGRSDPTEGMSGTGKFLAGMGKSFVDTGRGIGQLFGVTDGGDVSEARRLDAPLMDTGAGLAGNIVGQTAQIAAPVPGGLAAKAASRLGRAAPYAGAAARSGAFSATQGTVGDESRLTNAAVGSAFGAGGQAISAGGSALARGAVSRLDDAGATLARKAEGFGLQLGLPSLSENPLVRTVANQMERLPFSGATKRAKANQEAFNLQVGKTFGAKSDKITPDVFADAKTRLQNAFETLSSRNNLDLTTDHVAQIKSVIDEATRLGGSDTARMVKNWANELITKVDSTGSIPGKAYQSFDSRLAKVMKSGGEPAHYLGQLRDVIRSAMDDSISAGDRNAWNTIRKQYAALKTVEPLVAKSPAGNISPEALMGRVTADTAGKARMATGRAGDLGDLARIGQRFLKLAPNSGTADRLLVNTAVTGGLYGAQHQGLIDPSTAAMIGGGLLLNRMGLSALNSRALAAGDSRALNGLSRLLGPAPRALPAAANASGLPILIQGGRLATPEDIDRDRQIVERHRRQK